MDDFPEPGMTSFQPPWKPSDDVSEASIWRELAEGAMCTVALILAAAGLVAVVWAAIERWAP